MCGISAFIGHNVYTSIYSSLLKLRNRGYDSAGILTYINDIWKVNKYANEDAFELLRPDQPDDRFGVGIGHTRWATHGAKTDANAHPHVDQYNQFGLVHNGIIENYEEIKLFLSKHHYTFCSETDSEVIVQLLSFYSSHCSSTEEALQKVVSELEGTYALCILSKVDPNTIFFLRKGSPLLLGHDENKKKYMLVSEVDGFDSSITHYTVIENNDCCRINLVDQTIKVKRTGTSPFQKLHHSLHQWTPDPYPHWTLKEIMEQQQISQKVLCNFSRIHEDKVVLGGLEKIKSKVLSYSHMVLLGCGTSFFAAKSCVHLFRSVIETVVAFDAGEVVEEDLPHHPFLCVCISQSGETKDVYDKINMLKRKGGLLLGVINVVDSYIAREMDAGIYLHVGKEVGVASTKSFTAQVMALHLMACFLYQNKGLATQTWIQNLMVVEKQIEYVIQRNHEGCKSLAQHLIKSSHLFILGKGKYIPYAEEGCLKIKEIGYIHAEAYGSSSLKHGPYALIENGTPIILLVPQDENFTKHQSVKEEVLGRGAQVIGISDGPLDSKYTVSFLVPKSSFFGVLSNIILQLLAYELSVAKGINPDMPRNLAKVVTVD
jgi:glucosamine--fructose-6-phosphate aminotransferase (isomerizing)